MKKDDVKIGGKYTAKVSDKVVEIRIDAENRHGGWDATNLATGKKIRIKSAQRLRSEVKAAKQKGETGNSPRSELTAEEHDKLEKKRRAKKADGEQKPKHVSAIDAAAEVLKAAAKPMRCQELISAMAEKGLWSSPGGKTPAATLYSAILREIGTKGRESRFKKVERGQFEFAE